MTLPTPRTAPELEDTSGDDAAPEHPTVPEQAAPSAAESTPPERPARRRGVRTWFDDRGIATKISVAVLVAALGMVLNGAVGLVSLDRTSDEAQALYTENVVGIATIARVQNSMIAMQLAVANQALPRNESETQRYTDDALAAEAELRAALEEYRTAVGDDEEAAALLTTFESGLLGYLEVRDKQLLPAGAAGEIDRWTSGRAATFSALMRADGALAALVEREDARAEAAAAATNAVTTTSRRLFITVTAWMLGLAVLLGVATARAVRSKVLRVQTVADSLEDGDLTVTTGLRSRDEIGRMGQALDAAVARLRDVVGTIETSATTLASSARQLSTSTDRIAATAEGTSTRAGTVSAAAEQVSRNIQVVAAASGQMSSSVEAIATDAAQASTVARTAVDTTAETKQTVHRLGDSSRQVGDVVRLITSIAEQTNLLALNATIEAARAGEAGKGFAVVAGEVKDLAQETARATGDIATRIATIQADTSGAVDAIEQISEIITRIDAYQSSIAGAVEEQRASTGEMTRSVVEAAAGSGEIATGIADVAAAADVTTTGVGASQRAVGDLARMSDELSALVGRFRL